MDNYIINSNDNLWQIAKNVYGDNLKSNSDIQNAVDKIVETNNIENPNIIYAGNALEIPSLFEDENDNSSIGEDENLFKEFDKWQNMHAINMEKYANGDHDEDAYNHLTEKIGTTFDFMEGKDASNEKDYNEQTLKLARGEIKQKDGNEDELVDFTEYFSHEFVSSGALNSMKECVKSGIYTEDEAVKEITDIYLKAQTVFNIIDENMGNGDGYIDETELQAYYKYEDSYDNAKDKNLGSIHIDDVSEYPEYLASQVDYSDIDTTAIEKMMRNLLAD